MALGRKPVRPHVAAMVESRFRAGSRERMRSLHRATLATGQIEVYGAAGESAIHHE